MRATLLFWAKLVFCYMELLKYCRNVANVKTLWYSEVIPKNRHPHLRLKHRRADAEHIRPAANSIQLGYHKPLQLRRISMKTKKRFFTLMLALALAVCMAVPAFASNEDSNFMIPLQATIHGAPMRSAFAKRTIRPVPMSTTISRPAPIGLLSVLTAHPAALVLGMTVPA